MNTTYRYRVARRVSIVNAITNTLLAIIKVIIGVVGHSHALIADGLHSFSDLINDSLVLIAAKAGGRTPDKEHPYGHRRIETLAAVLISIIVIGVALGIGYDAIPRLLGHKQQLTPELSVIIAALVSIGANEWLYRYTKKGGEEIHSNLLITHAIHNRSDALVSVIVLFSAGGAMLGWPILDAIGALAIALLILKMGGQMMWNGLRELIDTGVSDSVLQEIMQTILSTPGVQSIHQLRTRTHGSNIFVDLHIIVNPRISVSEGHYISDQVMAQLSKKFPHIADVTVHIDPEDDENFRPSVNLYNRPDLEHEFKKRCQHLTGFSDIYKIQLHYLAGNIHMEIFMPLLAAQGKQTKALEEEYCEAIADLDAIESLKIYFS